jgi:hypothetical protein
MGIGLVLSALSGAGQGVADAAQTYEKYNFQQMLQKEASNLAVERADLVNQHAISAANVEEARKGAIGQAAADAYKASHPIPGAIPATDASGTTPDATQPVPQVAPTVPALTPDASASSSAPSATTPVPVTAVTPAGPVGTPAPGSTPLPATGLVPSTIKTTVAASLSPAEAAQYRGSELARAQAFRDAGDTARASQTMADLEKTFHTLGYAGSNDLLTGETITGQAAMIKAQADYDAAHGSKIDPVKQLELQGKTLEHDNKILDSALGDDTTIKSLMSNPMYAVNPVFKANADAQIDNLRATRSAVLQIAQESGHAVPVTTALSLVQGLKTGATKVMNNGGTLYFDMGGGRFMPIPQALVASIKQTPAGTPSASQASAKPGAAATPAALPTALNIKQLSQASYIDGYEPAQFQWFDPRTGTYKQGTKNSDGTYLSSGGQDGKTETFAGGQ